MNIQKAKQLTQIIRKRARSIYLNLLPLHQRKPYMSLEEKHRKTLENLLILLPRKTRPAVGEYIVDKYFFMDPSQRIISSDIDSIIAILDSPIPSLSKLPKRLRLIFLSTSAIQMIEKRMDIQISDPKTIIEALASNVIEKKITLPESIINGRNCDNEQACCFSLPFFLVSMVTGRLIRTKADIIENGIRSVKEVIAKGFFWIDGNQLILTLDTNEICKKKILNGGIQGTPKKTFYSDILLTLLKDEKRTGKIAHKVWKKVGAKMNRSAKFTPDRYALRYNFLSEAISTFFLKKFSERKMFWKIISTIYNDHVEMARIAMKLVLLFPDKLGQIFREALKKDEDKIVEFINQRLKALLTPKSVIVP